MNQAQSRVFKISLFLLSFGIFLYAIHPILMPFVFGALIAYLGDPLVDKLEKFITNISRSLEELDPNLD